MLVEDGERRWERCAWSEVGQVKLHMWKRPNTYLLAQHIR
jgi:hypothetical protein